VKRKPTILDDAGKETAAVKTDHAELACVHETLGFGRGLRVNVCFQPRTDYDPPTSLGWSNTRYTYGMLRLLLRG
jgi:hypothetical protein